MKNNKNNLFIYLLLPALIIALGICTVHYQSLEERPILEDKGMENPIQESILPKYEFLEGNFTDIRDNQVYQWMEYSNGQKWMAQNLNYASANSVCYNEESDCAVFGRLYTWSAALKACPKGWRLAKKADWEKLFNYFGGEKNAFSILQDDNNSFGIKMNGAYNSAKKSFQYKNQNGNYWTATSVSKAKARHYNFSKEFQQIFSVEEHKSLALSCRCIEGQKEQIIASSNKPKKKEAVNKAVQNSIILTENKAVIPSKNNPVKGDLSFSVFNEGSQEFQSLPIKINEEKSADLIKRRPPKNKKETNPKIRFEYTGKGYPYVIALAPKEYPKLIHSLSGDFDNADLILKRPKPKSSKSSKRIGANYFLQQEPISEFSMNERCFLVLLSSTSLEEQELLNKISSKQNAFIHEILLKQQPNKKGETRIVQNIIKHQFSGEEAVIIPLVFSLQPLPSSI